MSKTNAIQKPVILVTRPEKQGRELVQKLQNSGFNAISQPLFSYKLKINKTEITSKLSKTNNPILIFVSVAAVEFAHKAYRLNDWQHSCVIAVGKKTQQALLNLGIEAISPTQQDSEGLLTLSQLQSIEKRDVIIVRGDGGRELIAQSLSQRGGNVQYLEVYQRVWLKLQKDIDDVWQKQNVNTVVVTSNALLESIVNLIDVCDNYWQSKCLWVVPSQRVADNAAAMGLQKVINANGASDKAILEALVSA